MTETKWQTLTHTLLRVFAAGVYMQHGVQKVISFMHHEQMGPLQDLAMVMETVFAACIILGLFTHVLAFLCSGEMAVAYFMFHAPRGLLPVINHGETPSLLCFIFLYLSAIGAGAFSLDAVPRRKRSG
jgi:putative oxidoreductase